MQNQPTDAGSSLQRQQTGLQQNAPSLQQNTSPATASETGNFLNSYPGTRELTVQNLGDPLPPGSNQVQNNDPFLSFPVLVLIIVPIAVAIALFWPSKRRNQPLEQSTIEPVVEEPVVSKPKAKPAAKSKKKQSRRQRTAKR
jgi:hypothetical protein